MHARTHTKQSLYRQDGHANQVRQWGAWTLIKPELANPSGGGLVPCRWGRTMPRVMVWAPKVPPKPHPLADMDTHTYTHIPRKAKQSL